MQELNIIFYDVGHGNCTRIITPNGKNILVDIGSPENNSICKYLHDIGLRKVDMLYITHPHKDHIYDLPNMEKYQLKPTVLSRDHDAFPIDHINNDGNETDKQIQDTANNMNTNYNHPVRPENDVTRPENNGGVYIDSLYAKSKDKNKNDPNSYSSIISIQYKGWKILITGDNNKEILQDRCQNDEDFRKFVKGCDILLAPHHGRSTDFCKDFFDLVSPCVTVVSDKSIKHDSQRNTSDNYNNGRGLKINGEDRFVLTTRKDGTIKLTITEEGKYNFELGATNYGN